MSLTSQPGAYTDCYRLFEAAVANNGMRVPFASDSKARYFQMRMNQARVIQRAESRRAYPPEHPLYNKSEYDPWQVTVQEDVNGEFWVYVKPAGDWDAIAAAEPIPESEQTTVLEPAHRPRQLSLTHRNPDHADQSDDLV